MNTSEGSCVGKTVPDPTEIVRILYRLMRQRNNENGLWSLSKECLESYSPNESV